MVERKKWRKATAVGVAVLMLAVGLVLLFLLTQATGSGDFYERNYEHLFALNVLVAALLGLAIVWGMWRLWLRQRRGKFGSRLLIRFAMIFGLASVLPGLLIYSVSYQFVAQSIENWFDVKVEGALTAGVNLGSATLDALAGEFGSQVRNAARSLNEVSDASAGVELERIKDQLGATDLVLWSNQGQVLASTGTQLYQLGRTRPAPSTLRQARASGVVTQIEGIDEQTSGDGASKAAVRAIAVVTASGLGLALDTRYLEVVQPLPQSLVQNALAVQEANREYQERALSRTGLQRMYIGTLTLSFFLAVFGALIFAAVFGKQLATPLLMLADGVRQVAAGDLTPKPALHGKDEMEGLTRSFAEMTRQLSDAREAVANSMAQLDRARASLQTILDNITAGVMVLNPKGEIQSANPGATRILRVPLADSLYKSLADLPGLKVLGDGVEQQFALMLSEQSRQGMDHWQQTYVLHDSEGMRTDAQTLVVRGALLPDSTWLVVFDDISEVVSAERLQAWGEVARRLAHEIKNPLTPIQLSAERLEYKLLEKLSASDALLLQKGVKTIVDQVDAMKRLVNEFRDFARLPTAQLGLLNLNALIAEVLHMYDHESARFPKGISLQAELDPACPCIMGDAMQLRQVIHNLVQNGLDASENVRDLAQVVIRTQWLPDLRLVRLSVQDTGSGFSDAILKRAFEPYVTTKAKGTGLGLAMVKKIAEEHNALIELGNRVNEGQILGAQVSLSFMIPDSQPGA